MSQALFSLRLEHPYYTNGEIPNLRISPDFETANILRRFQTVSRNTNGIFSLYQFSSTKNADVVEALIRSLESKPLRFILQCDIAKFYWITDIQLSWKGKIHISSNNRIDQQYDGRTNLKIEFEENLPCPVDCLGIFDLYPKDLQNQNTENANYLAIFSQRKLHWKYYVINRSQTQLHNPRVARDDGTAFDPPDVFVTPSGEKSLRFSSGNKSFPLQQNPLQKFDLIDRYKTPNNDESSTIENTLIRGLPTPQDFQIDIATESGNQYVYSAMYVYL
jgi:hypothetical protein